jgi:hypothetical protein
MGRVHHLVLAAFMLGACRPAVGPQLDAVALWDDPDRQPFSPKPRDDAPTRFWDGADHIVFRPVSQFFAVRPGGESVNVNAMDEVPTSSWFTNRIGLLPMSPDDVASGPCEDPPLDTDAPLTVQSSKLDGVTPGFVIKSARGKKYLLKLDDTDQTPRSTAADAIGARLYYAAGYTTPCNRVVFFERSRLRIAPGAELKTWIGKKEPLRQEHLDVLLTHASRLADGRYRALASQWIQGQPIGPWRYEETRSSDPNDTIPHEDRRDVRGVRLLAAWIDNTDSRAQNTLDVWIPNGKGGRGFVRHTIIDFSDGFGAIWAPVDAWRRMGHAYVLDPGLILGNFFSLGLRVRRWEDTRFGAAGKVFGYYDVDSFDPDAWKMETPNTAFSRMSERDGAWMARIISQFTDEHLRRAIAAGRLGSDLLEAELLRILSGRRDKILRRYFSRLSPLATPTIQAGSLCLRDLVVATGIESPRSYVARLRLGAQSPPLSVRSTSAADICIPMPSSVDATAMIDVAVAGATAPGPLRVHVRLTRENAAIVGVERL